MVLIKQGTMTSDRPVVRAGAMTSIALDPFGFQPHLASKISGLGGDDPGSDPAYVFHTPYVPLPEPSYELTFAFEDLRASGGALVVRVNALGDGRDARAATIATEQFRLPDLARGSGGARLRFDAGPGRRYAVLGHFYADELASATRLTIEVAPAVRPALRDAATARSSLAPGDAAETNMLIAGRPPSLKVPLSQHATASQMAEAAQAGDGRAWIAAYLHRVRQVYAIGPDAVLATIGSVPAELASAIAPQASAPDGLQAPMLDPADWVIAAIEDGHGPPSDPARLALTPLRPGGVGLLTLSLALDADPPAGAFTLARLQRLGVELLSHGYDVTQVAIDPGDAIAVEGVTPFVMIVRR